MRKAVTVFRTIVIVFLLTLPGSLTAAGESVARAEGFRLIWEPLGRTIEETTTEPFSDVSETHPDFRLITYAKNRKILDEEQSFRPSDPLKLEDAIIWLIRTRNITYADEVTAESVEHFRKLYRLFPDLTQGEDVAQAQLAEAMYVLDEALKKELHTVSFYAEEFAGQTTAFGETFNPDNLTAAHRTFPQNTLVRVTHLDLGKSVVVRINDRGPYVDGRDMDLSLAAFEQLAPRSVGILSNVTFERIGNGKVNSQERTPCQNPDYQRRVGEVSLTPGIPRIALIGSSISLGADRSFRLLYIRRPKGKPTRPREWTRRGETLEINFDHIGTYTFILHEDGGGRRRFRTRVTDSCT